MATKKRNPSPQLSQGLDSCPQTMRTSPGDQIKMLQRQVEHAEQRTDIEKVAMQVAGLVENIQAKRAYIKSLKNELESSETQLNTCLLEHQIAVAKFKELGAIPQPTA